MTIIGGLAGLALLFRLIQREAWRVRTSTALPELANDSAAHLPTIFHLGALDIVLWVAAAVLLLPRLIGLLT